MELSVIICSYNRAVSLGNTLTGIGDMTGLNGLDWEVLVVDNGSEDNTAEVVTRFGRSGPFPVRYVREEQRGLSFARNRGVSEARGALLAFTDDDVLVDRLWAANIVKAFRTFDPACIGGRIFPLWERPKPKWLCEELHKKLALLDYGDEPLVLETPSVWGANFIMKAEACRFYGPFDTRVGRVPGKLYAGEETALIGKLLRGKEKVMYVPDVVVYHHVPEERMKKTYFRRWVYDEGELAGLLLGEYTNRNILGIPLYLFRDLILNASGLSVAGFKRGEDFFMRQLALIGTVGTFAGRLKWRFSGIGPGRLRAGGLFSLKLRTPFQRRDDQPETSPAPSLSNPPDNQPVLR